MSTAGDSVADALVDGVIEWAHGLGATEVRLSVRRTNERAIRFDLRAGFLPSDEPAEDPTERAMVRPLQQRRTSTP